MRRRLHWLLAGAAGFFMFVLTGCAIRNDVLLQNLPAQFPQRMELSAVPFHPQARFQCGPAALAMALNAAAIAATPDELTPQVFVPQREGSLPPEMLAAARRNGALGAIVPPRLDALIAEIAAGNPVIVLQNLSLPVFPLWHYALAIGYDLDEAEIILRSGVTERLTMPLSTFEHTWARSGRWAMVALPPDRLPATLDEAPMVEALVAYEKSAGPGPARQAYEQALHRWPRNPTLRMGYGNTAYALGDLAAAAAAFEQVAQAHPDNAAAFNNLATALAELGDLKGAEAAAARAVAIGGHWREAAERTLQSIRAKRGMRHPEWNRPSDSSY